ncbi:MAG: transglutaminase TgpA family protein [Pyrinomonadaceae bacterium]
MSLEIYFRAFSYATVAVATLTLMLAGGLSLGLAALLLLFMAAAWMFEGTRWQLSERTGLVVVLLSIPLFFLDWQYQKTIGESAGRVGVNALAHLIVFLAVVKLLQVKKDRDWVFLYLISFFEVLLAAGLSFSPVFLGSLTIYLLCGLSTIIAFEIQKSKRATASTETHLLVAPDSRIFKNAARRRGKGNAEANRLPFVALVLLLLIIVLAVPLFLVAPRSGAAGLIRSGGGLTNFIGFSENVTLGEIGILKRDNAVVMRVRVEDQQMGRPFRWRGVALDEFTGSGWKKSAEVRRTEKTFDGPGLIQLGTITPEALNRLTTQTVFLEPIESPVIFAAFRAVAIQGNFSFLRVDAEDSVQGRRRESARVMYKAHSDMTEPDPDMLRSDVRSDPPNSERYEQLPARLDPRIAARANAIVANAHASNRYDEAKAIESQLQQDYGYSLQMKAGGADPLADFLFNVKTGHCEYFSTAMAVMLRTRGIPSRVVNGFLPGEYNDAADAYTVRQSDAHSWIEVYFPETRSWVTFDPTPIAGRTEPVSTGFAAQAGKYAEALELIWFQYVVGYDKQEQRSLAASVQGRLADYRRSLALLASSIGKTISSESRVVGYVGLGFLGAFLLVVVAKRVRRFGWRRGLSIRPAQTIAPASTVLFYERLTELLARRGVERDSHLTPLEFAGSLDFQPALAITRAYNRVRFGGQPLSPAELREIDQTLKQLEVEKKI